MAATPRVRSTVALLSVLALIGNLLAGSFLQLGAAHASMPSAQAPASVATQPVVDPVLGVLPICHPGGEAAAAGGETPANHPGGGAGHCPACTLIAKFAVTVAFAFEPIAFVAALLPRQPVVRTQPLADHLRCGGIRSRAPPLTA